jgi:aminopeptidase N
MLSVTRDEAVVRAALITVDHYEIELDLSAAVDDSFFISTTTIRFRCADAGAATFVELAAESILDGEFNGVALDVAADALADGRLLLSPLAGDNQCRVRARMAYSTAVEGIHRFVDPADGEVYLYAQAGPEYAKRIFACFDQPDLKAPLSLTVLAPPGWTVRANGAGAQVSTGRWEFAPTERISTYLMTVIAGPYYEHPDRVVHDGIPLGLLCRRSLAPQLDQHAGEILQLTAACFDRYHEMFAIRYPFGKYDQVFVPEFTWGAVENPGCVTFREELLFRSAATETQLQSRAVVIAHEMAHMWFGDLVTLRWWDDIWLNESFAEYLGWRVTVEATRYAQAWTTFAVGRKSSGYVADQRPSTHPVAPDDVRDAAQAILNFDGISYAKGASVLRQLVAWIGDEAFITGLRAFFAAHAFGNATLADLLAAWATASGRDLDAWAAVWLRTPQVNTVRPQVTIDQDGRYSRVVVVQTAHRDHPVLRPHRIGIGCYDPDGAGPRLEVDLDPSVDSGQTEVAELAGVKAPAVLLLNDGDISFVKVRFDGRSQESLAETLPRLTDPLARALVWGALADATRDGDLSARHYLDLVSAALPAETSVAIVEDVLRFAEDTAAKRYLPEREWPAALAGLARLCHRLAQDGPDTCAVSAVRGFVACATESEVDTLTSWLADGGVPGGVAVDAELRWAIVYRLVVLGHAGEPLIAAEYARDPSAQGAQSAARCRAAIAAAEPKAAAWRAVTGLGGPSLRVRSSLADGFWQPEQERLTEAYVDRYFTELPELARQHGPNEHHAIVFGLYPRYAVSAGTVAAADAMLARDDLDPALRRVVVDATDELRRALAARSLP